MKFAEIISEGGWSSTATQGTTITPALVKQVLPVVKQFIGGFNKWLATQQMPPMKMGHPIGSTAYYQRDDEDTEYGDIDLQTIAPDHPDKTDSQVARQYNELLDRYVADKRPPQIHYEGKSLAGHPIFNVGDQYVQVDFVWTTEKYADWSRYRMTPARGVKGAVHGSMFSSFGEVINISIQSVGAQMKVRDGEAAPFARTRKYDSLETLSLDMRKFGLDIVRWLHKKMDINEPLRLSKTLKANPGLNVDDIRSEQLASVLKGMAETFEINDMYGKFNLSDYNNKDELINAFLEHFKSKMEKAASASKFDKAEGPEAVAKAKATKDKLLGGISFVTKLMTS